MSFRVIGFFKLEEFDRSQWEKGSLWAGEKGRKAKEYKDKNDFN